MKSINYSPMTMGLLIGLLTAVQNSITLGAIRWGEVILR